jgi:hypothetical protein
MHQIQQMFQSHPGRINFKSEEFAACIQACVTCAETCTACADACLAEETVAKLTSCIRTNLDCAEICKVAGTVLCRQTEPKTEFVHALLQTVLQAVRDCAAECEEHAAHMEHCRICALACRACEQKCEVLLQNFEAMAA